MASAPKDDGQLTSFGFLQETHEEHAPSSFSSLFSRMRSALGAGAPLPQHTTGAGPAAAGTAQRAHACRDEPLPLLHGAPAQVASPTPLLVNVSRDTAHDTSPAPSMSDVGEPGTSAFSVPGVMYSIAAGGDSASIDTKAHQSAEPMIRRIHSEGIHRRFWMADETARECRECLLPFTPLRRRHHCRVCGQIFCRKCAANSVPGARFGLQGDVRACRQCVHKMAEHEQRARHEAEEAELERTTPSIVGSPEAHDVHTPQSQFSAHTLFGEKSSPLSKCARQTDSEEDTPSELASPAGRVDEVSPFRSVLEEREQLAFDDAPISDEEPDTSPDTAEPPPLAPAKKKTLDAPHSPVRRSNARQTLMRGTTRFVTSTALGTHSLVYFLRMLHQLLVAERIDHVQEWKEIIKLLALAVIERIRVRTRNTDLTDIRNFVKVKNMPGGQISDCEFLDGYICSKNVATKKMGTFLPLRNARVMVLAFALEYHDASQLMALEPIMAQEHEFIRILVARILAHRPNVVLVEKSVSRYALQLFEEARVPVFSCMKRSSVVAVALCTQADVIASVDRLALEPRLGRCVSLTVDMYEYEHAPMRRKALLRIEVAHKDVSSALVLRGASLPKLRRIKAILTLMAFVGYNLKLEEHMRRDTGLVLDWSVVNIEQGSEEPQALSDLGMDAYRKMILAETLKKYQRLILSASITVNFPLPFLITRMKQVVDRIEAVKAALPEEPTTFVYTLQNLVDETQASFPLFDPRSASLETELLCLEAQHAGLLHSWHACVTNMAKMLTPFSHQKLLSLDCTVSAASLQSCAEPACHSAEYYGVRDVPLGQMLERTCTESAASCAAKKCNTPALLHYKTFVHSTMRVQMVVERFVCPIEDAEHKLLCWSYCKQCGATTPITELSDEAWSLSFAKYLELQCYPNAACHSSVCSHDYYREGVRYFALHNLAIRFHADPVAPWEVVVPPKRLFVYPEKMYALKNEETVSMLEKNADFWNSVLSRIHAFQEELCTREIYNTDAELAGMQTDALELLGRIMRCARADYAAMQKLAMQVYWDADRDLLMLNEVRRAMQDKVVEWDALFHGFDKHASISDRQLRRLTSEYVKKRAEPDDSTEAVQVGADGHAKHEAPQHTSPAPDPRRADEQHLAACTNARKEQPRERARPVTSAHATVAVFKSMRDAVGAESDSDSDDPPRVPVPETENIAREGGPECATLFDALEEKWTLHCGAMRPLVYPFLHTDHVFSDSRVVVREDEPSSIIAFTLDSRTYKDQLLASQEARIPSDLHHELCSTAGTHYGYEFATSSVTLSCKIFFAEQFDALRRMCHCDTIIQSLSRCIKWDSSGGKSGSSFLKTRDDRFVMKQLSRAEMDGFSKFAPQYFAYMADCRAANRPTTLTKIFGYYRIGVHNTHSGKSMKLDVVVMENLSYGHSIHKMYDLKGSTRNRFVHEAGRDGEVLMDENLVQASQQNPLLVREHAKRIMRAALYNDTLFLTDMNVMDYSLFVALDEPRGELVMGIIDYVRTYTWDKRVESFVKETAILGGGGKGEPTIITPRQYRMRFLAFMDRYFFMVRIGYGSH
ncbi:1-phosphatidylinositol-3-phosphate 5-kinase [Malassezia vespertilionis]|uniref:1-phosphatidylinositol-3-phosphate 5-kinase n=1 Tax=Malassezia vespertilionis TaxID=2020962 RepID=UPI0024B0A354|nr:1-phosphatidylinositol-3-phosphate 5-kinase [Malassezia vespertilionis]WFD08327.1 1-phosphatidylinositol-3-phosphate 5-kinase [Malassezia vespertilionis]